jgi:tyrosine-protein phosphatase YwqE
VIDTHSHVLPGVDDGARSIGDAVAMARQFVDSGVTAVVCTPHLSTQFRASTEQVTRELERLRSALSDLGIDLDLRLGTEFTTTTVRTATPAALAERAITGRYVLVELVSRTSRADAVAAIEAVHAAGLSLVGRVADAVRASAWSLLGEGLVDLVGSDAHRPLSASIRLDLLADLIAQRIDRATAERLLAVTPARLLAG